MKSKLVKTNVTGVTVMATETRLMRPWAQDEKKPKRALEKVTIQGFHSFMVQSSP